MTFMDLALSYQVYYLSFAEVQFWEYQIAAMRYQLTQRPLLRKYLLNACYNSEEENYSLSLKREPIVKK